VAYINPAHTFTLLLLQLYLNVILRKVVFADPNWPRGLKLRAAAARLLGLWVRIPPEAWMLLSCECCVLPGRGLCVGLITPPEESYRVWYV
jgi:hypothetical protein